MKKVQLFCYSIVLLLSFSPLYSQSKDSVYVDTIVCLDCDTNFYYKKPIGGELTAMYPQTIHCYYQDSTGERSPKKCHVQNFKKGQLHGTDVKYRYTKDTVYLKGWGGRYKHEPKKFVKRFFARPVLDYWLVYKGYWKNGQKHGIWKYYNEEGYIIRIEEYKKGVLINLRVAKEEEVTSSEEK